MPHTAPISSRRRRQLIATLLATTVAGSTPAVANLTPASALASGQPNSVQTPAVTLGTITQVAVGTYHAVGIRADGSVIAWGNDAVGLLDVPPDLGPCVTVSTRDGHTLALTYEGEVVAWGANDAGQCTIPSAVDIAIDVAAGDGYSLAVDSHGAVYGWGANQHGQASAPANLGPAFKLAASHFHSAALLVNGTVKCWGLNNAGQCNVPSSLGSCKKVVLGELHSVALRNDGTVICWGSNSFGQCSPPANLGPCIDISAGAYYTMAVRADGSLVAWGSDANGQLELPALPPGGSFTRVSAGRHHWGVALADMGEPTRDRMNADLRSDLVFHNKTAKECSVWMMNGLAIESAGLASQSYLLDALTPLGMGDFNGDGTADILWRRVDGTLHIWFMKGQLVMTSLDVVDGYALPKKTSVIGIGDINGDRMADIILRNGATEAITGWLMHGHVRATSGLIGSATGLKFAAHGDFDGDERTDLAFRTTSGVVQLWMLDTFSKTTGPVQNANAIASHWQVQAAGDLDGDGNDDLVWRNTQDGQVNGWLLDGFVKKAGGPMGTIGTQWTLETCLDLNADGKGDLAWTNSTTTQVNGWIMNGLTKVSGGTIGATGPGTTMVNR